MTSIDFLEPILRYFRLNVFRLLSGRNPFIHIVVKNGQLDPSAAQLMAVGLQMARVIVTGFLGVAFSLPTASAAAEGELLWESPIAEQPVGPTDLFGKDLEIREENGVKFLAKSDFVTGALIDDRKGANWMDYVFTVKYRETEKSTVTFVLKARVERSEAPYLWYYIFVTPGGIAMHCHGIPKDLLAGDPRLEGKVTFEEMGASNFSLGEWVTAEIAVGAEVLKVTVTPEDGQARRAEFKVLPGTGGVAVASRAPLEVASAIVRDAGNPVLPAE